MEKLKRWHFYVIIAVVVWTLYNILPTLFYYAQPLHEPVDAKAAEVIAKDAVDRVDQLEKDAILWIRSFSDLLHVNPLSIEVSKQDPRLIEVDFSKKEESALFSKLLPKAGDYIPFVPAQLQLLKTEGTKVTVLRHVGLQVDAGKDSSFYQFASKRDSSGKVGQFYAELIKDRAEEVAFAVANSGQTKHNLRWIVEGSLGSSQLDDLSIAFAKEVVEIETIFGASSPLTKRYFSTLAISQGEGASPFLQKVIARLDAVKSRLNKQKGEMEKQSEKSYFVEQLKQNELTLEKAIVFLRKEIPSLKKTVQPIQLDRFHAQAKQGNISLQGNHPLIESVAIDWNGNAIHLIPYSDVQAFLDKQETSEIASLKVERLNQWLMDTIAEASRVSGETILPEGDVYSIRFDTLPNPTGILAFDLRVLAKKQMDQLTNQLKASWNPQHHDLKRESYPIITYEEFQKLKPEVRQLSLLTYAPVMEEKRPEAGFRNGSIYFIAKGLSTLIQKAEQFPEAPESKQFLQEVNELATLLQAYGFIGYPASGLKLGAEWDKDYVFELDDFYSMWLKATREDVYVKGNQKFAVLELSDVEQRILTKNKIEDKIQEDLLKWEEEYHTAQVDLNQSAHYLIPAPTKSPFWQNLKLSFVKYFRGDDRKILKWGLDLSGGKTVRVGLADANGKPVSNPDDLKQAVSELYERINKLGVSERTIRLENKTIVVDFPGSQALSASDLVQASSMYFYIVNEKFTPSNSVLKDAVNTFLQNVWNEAVVTNRKDSESINEIAWRHLGGDLSLSEENVNPKTDVARILYDNGLRLANPKNPNVSEAFNDTLSRVGVMRGDDYAEWEGQANPLIFLFHNFALEGSSLTNIRVGYDPMQGNILSFNIRGYYSGSQERSGNPRDDFYAWTSQFAEDRIQGTPKESYSQGRGWRMAVVLNGTVISKPALKAALKDGATISGRFSQREINQLAADLKAGSLSFTPKILSEENVSPELGKEERTKGFVASFVALVAVVVLMVSVYRFAGIVASCAVLFNILIMWGVLQNLDAALTLPGIAGIVLTIGMAVDANVLVFERIREEFAISHRLSSAIQAGYRKAFSAIIDSNITTIIAGIILIQFDSGPIKGFAVTLIIGIISSMFTALFMTRTFFSYWVQHTKDKELKMVKLFEGTKIDFLKLTRQAILTSLVLTLLGAFFFFQERHTLFGMDFTGGYSLQVTLKERADHPSYRLLAKEAFLAKGASSNAIQIRELSQPNKLRIQFGMGMEEKGYPFYHMPEKLSQGAFSYEYEKNPRIMWVVEALHSQGLEISPDLLPNLENQWTSMSGQFSDTMRYQAVVGLLIALLAILVYITFRFEWKYAISAVIALTHDLVITLGILALFHKLGFPVEIDLQVVGALMTIIGYSLNDTIIVFDRIREDVLVMRKMPLSEVINHALNVTLSRTLMTSGTTLAVLLALVFLGGPTLFGFSLVMSIGVLVGTFSSLFIAAPALLFFHQRELKLRET